MGTTEVKPSVYLKRRFKNAKVNNGSLTFRQFVRKLAAGGDTLATAWLFNKSAHVNDEAKALKQKTRGAVIAATKLATKLSRKKTKTGGSGKTPKAE